MIDFRQKFEIGGESFETEVDDRYAPSRLGGRHRGDHRAGVHPLVLVRTTWSLTLRKDGSAEMQMEGVIEARERNDKQGGHKVGKLGRAGKCIYCRGKVSGGGDRHGEPASGEKFSAKCSRRGIFGDHRRRLKQSKRLAKLRKNDGVPQRGVAVVGTGKVSASSSRTKTGKAGLTKGGK